MSVLEWKIEVNYGCNRSPENDMREPWRTYYKLSEVIRTSRDIHDKLAACEASFEVLPDFVTAELDEYGELPPTILCRDVAPKLYMQLGQFQKARVAIYRCVKAGAYHMSITVQRR